MAPTSPPMRAACARTSPGRDEPRAPPRCSRGRRALARPAAQHSARLPQGAAHGTVVRVRSARLQLAWCPRRRAAPCS